MRIKLARLFTIKTRTEVWFVIYALALGAVERGRVYLETYPGYGGWLLALACTGVVFLAGAKLLDSVKPVAGPARKEARAAVPRRRPNLIRSRPRARPSVHGGGSRRALRKD